MVLQGESEGAVDADRRQEAGSGVRVRGVLQKGADRWEGWYCKAKVKERQMLTDSGKLGAG